MEYRHQRHPRQVECCGSGLIPLCRNNPAGEDFVAVVEGGELTGGDAPLGLVEEDEQAIFTAEDPGVLKGLAIPDPDPVTTHPAKGRKAAGTDFVNLFRQYPQTAAG